MANIELIKQLRDRTGAGIMDCKKALVENNDDLQKAIVWLREKGIAKQEKKASRTAAEGVAWVLCEGNEAAVIEINCETDFVANSDPFRALVKEANLAVLHSHPSSIDEAKAAAASDGRSINDWFLDASIKLGEKLDFRRFEIIHKNDDEIFAPYIHMKGKIATLVIISGGNPEVANGVALTIASTNPSYTTIDDIPADVIARETEIETEAAKNDPSFAKKPANVQQKIIEGKVRKNLCSNVLTEQLYVLDQSKTVSQYLKENSASVVSYVRYAVGEGIEKRQDDWTKEVAAGLEQH